MIFHLFFSLQVFIKFDNQSFFCLLFFSKRDVVKTKTEMIFHLFFFLQVFIKFNNQRFFCLLFFSKRDVVKTKNRDDFSSFFLSASIYQIR